MKKICLLICLSFLSCQEGSKENGVNISAEQENALKDSILANKENYIFLSFWPGIDAESFDYVSKKEVERGNLFVKDEYNYYYLKYGNESKEFLLSHHPGFLKLSHYKEHSGPTTDSQERARSLSYMALGSVLNLFEQKYGEPENKYFSPKFNNETVNSGGYVNGERRYYFDYHEYHIFRANDKVVTINDDNYFPDLRMYTENDDGSVRLGTSRIVIKYYSPDQYIRMNSNRLKDSINFIREINALQDAKEESYRRKRQEVLDEI